VGRVAGTVVELRGNRARVACQPAASSCGACSSGRGCGWSRRGRAIQLEIPAELDGRRLEPGTEVELEADEGPLLAAAARLYLPPLAGLLLGPTLLRVMGLDAGVAPLVAATAGLLAGALVARAWTHRAPVVLARRA
jgi:positive regulator of sigma E activity